jgi:SAM-dependent methyltransferase
LLFEFEYQYEGMTVSNLIEGLSNTGTRNTRGYGLLEPFLAKQRARIANQLIPNELRQGRILDIGCGSYPYFLSHTYFKEEFAIDQLIKPKSVSKINWFSLNLNDEPHLPFEDEYFSAITMLAVVEHLSPTSLVLLLKDVHRSLKPDGKLIITTPAAWSDGLLRILAQIQLVSKEEIDEHVFVYTLPLLGWYFGRAGFELRKVRFGYFEFHLNLWAVATR